MRNRKLFPKVLFILLCIVTIGNFFYHVYAYRGDIFQRFDYSYWTYRYMHSQWSPTKSCLVTDPHINPHTCIWDDNWYAQHPKILPQYQKISIGDDGLYMYAGAAYVKGLDPSLLNAELPPLGKYLVGIFELTTGYNGFFSVFFSGLALVLFFFFNKKVLSSSLIAILPVTLFSFEPLFIAQIRAAYLDTLYLSVLLLGFLFLLHKKYLLSGIALGAFMAIKSPFLVVVVYMAVIGWLFMEKQLRLKILMPMIAATLLTYVASYISIFFHGHSIVYFFTVQKYIVHFYSSGAKAVIGAVFPLLFLGKWYTWFSPVQRVQEWTILWLCLSVGTVGATLLWMKDRKKLIAFQLLWIVLYMLFLIITPVFARYLLLVLPFMYNLSIWALLKSIGFKYS